MSFKIATAAAFAATGVAATTASDFSATSSGTYAMSNFGPTATGLLHYFDFADPRSCIDSNSAVLDKKTGKAKLRLMGGLKCNSGFLDNYLNEIPNTAYFTQAPGYHKNYTAAAIAGAPSTYAVKCTAGKFFCNKATAGANDFAFGGDCNNAAAVTATAPYAGLAKAGTCSFSDTGCCFDPCASGYCGTGAECAKTVDLTAYEVPTSSIHDIHDPATAAARKYSGDEASDTDKYYGYALELSLGGSTNGIRYGYSDGHTATTDKAGYSVACGDSTAANEYKWKITGNA